MSLLVSVRDAAEAAWVARTDVAIVDVKEPRNGSLGSASPEVLRDVANVVAGRKPLSAALGELHDDDVCVRCRDLPAEYAFAKIGLASMAQLSDWRERWRDAIAQVPARCASVAVVYADWQTCFAPSPSEILEVGSTLGCRALLVDTYDKSRGGLFARFAAEELRFLFECANALGMRTVAAGSLSLDAALHCRALGANLVAARGALCGAGRESSLSPMRVQEWLLALTAAPCELLDIAESALDNPAMLARRIR